MSTLFAEQQALLAHQLSILARLEQGIAYSLQRLPATLGLQDLQQPAIAERIAALNDRFTKLQDQLAGAMPMRCWASVTGVSRMSRSGPSA